MKFKHQLYILDRAETTLAVIGSHMSDTHEMSVLTGSSTYVFDINAKEDGVEHLLEGNLVTFKDYKLNGWCFTIMKVEKRHGSLHVSCENLGLELINKVVDKWEEPTAQPFSYYFNKWAKDSGWVIGINEISTLSRKLTWEGRSTSLERILSTLNSFDEAEIDFQVEFKNNRIVSRVANIYKKRGVKLSNVRLEYNDSVQDIVKTTSLYDFATALNGVGGTPEGENQVPISLTDYVYDDGYYFTVKGDPFLRARIANQNFNITQTYLEDFYDYDTLSVTELFNRTLSQLKNRSEAAINYEVEVAKFDDTLNLGDYVEIIDRDYKPSLFLQARVLTLRISYTDSKKSTAVFGNYTVLTSNISQQLRDVQNKLQNIKNGDSTFMWVRYADDALGNGISSMPANKKYVAFKPVLNRPVPSDNPSDYAGLWTLIKGENGSNGQNGEDGITYYMWIKYADNVNGGGISDNPDNKKFIGIATNKTSPIESTNPTDYVWSAMYDDAKLNELQNQLNAIVYPIVSETAPSSPREGMQWWKTDGTNDVVGFYVYKSNAWVEQSVQQSVLNIVALNAITITGSTITGTNINGSTITNTFDANFNGGNLIGTTKLDKGIVEIKFINKDDPTTTGLVELTPLGLSGSIFVNDSVLNGFEISSSGVVLRQGFKSVCLTYDELYDSGWVTVPAQNGMNTNCRVMRKFGLVTIDIWVNNPTTGSGANAVFGTLPPEFRPPKDMSTWIGTNSLTGQGIVRIGADGTMKVWSSTNHGASHSSMPSYSVKN